MPAGLQFCQERCIFARLELRLMRMTSSLPLSGAGTHFLEAAAAAGQWALLRAAATELPAQAQPIPFATGIDSTPLSPASSHLTTGVSICVLSSETATPCAHGSTHADTIPGSLFGQRVQSGVRSAAVLSPIHEVRLRDEGPRSCGSSCAGVIAITGGMGALGSLTAQWAGHGALGTASELLLTGRSGRSSQIGALQLALEGTAMGPCVTLRACDASSAEDAAYMTIHNACRQGEPSTYHMPNAFILIRRACSGMPCVASGTGYLEGCMIVGTG